MRTRRHTVAAAYPLLFFLLVVGCSRAAQQEPPTVEDRNPPAAELEPQEGTTYGIDDPEAGGEGSALAETKEHLLEQRSIYFDYDSDLIPQEYHPVIEAHANHMSQNPGLEVRLEGHADERGTREYNLALAERRAIAVRQLLSLMGAETSQVRTVSYGEEQPFAEGHDEEAWRLNRRVDLAY